MPKDGEIVFNGANMFGVGKRSAISQAEKNMNRDFGFTLRDIPGSQSVEQIFQELSQAASLSPESQTALLYRLVVVDLLGAAKVLRDAGQGTSPEDLVWVVEMINGSADWSERAPDQAELESITSYLNSNIERFLESLAISRN